MDQETKKQKMDEVRAKYAARSEKQLTAITAAYIDHVVADAQASGAVEMTPEEAIRVIEES